MFGKHGMKKQLRQWGNEPPKLWPLWARILVVLALLAFIAKIAYDMNIQ